MKIIIFLSLILFPIFVSADLVKFESNNWDERKPFKWSGTLIKIDKDSQIADFSFKNGSKDETFQVHITRIYSLELDHRNRVNRPFPKFNQDIKSPLGTDPQLTEKIELTSENFVEIPKEVKVIEDKKRSKLTLQGKITSAELQKIVLELKTKNKTTTNVDINRSDLLIWIRGSK